MSSILIKQSPCQSIYSPRTSFNILAESKPWEINKNKLPVTKELIHVGIQRERNSVTPAIEARTSNGGKTLNGLLGLGLQSKTGLPLSAPLHLYNIFVIPRTLYGLEALVINKPIITTLDLFQRKMLKSLMGVPERTAIPSMYITGILPMEVQIEQKQLLFLHSLVSEEGRLRDLVLRQYAMKPPPPKVGLFTLNQLFKNIHYHPP